MFRFSKVIRRGKSGKENSEEAWTINQTPEEYFAGWMNWFKQCGIKTEVRTEGETCSLWREGIEVESVGAAKYRAREK